MSDELVDALVAVSSAIIDTRRRALTTALDMLDIAYDQGGELTDGWHLAEQMVRMASAFFDIEQEMREAHNIDEITAAVDRWSAWLDLAVMSCERVGGGDA